MANLSQATLIAEALAELFRPYVEVVVHDIETSRIAAISNSFSRRSVGDDSMIKDAAGLDEGPDIHGPFEHRALDGRRLRYISVVLRDDEGKAEGLMCVNLDVSPLEKLEDRITSFLRSTGDSAALDSHFRDDWQDRIRAYVQDYCQNQGTNAEQLSRQARGELVQALHHAGAFRAKNAAGFVANVLGVSRATVYKDLAQARAAGGEPANVPFPG